MYKVGRIVTKGMVTCVILADLYSCGKHDVYEGDGKTR